MPVIVCGVQSASHIAIHVQEGEYKLEDEIESCARLPEELCCLAVSHEKRNVLGEVVDGRTRGESTGEGSGENIDARAVDAPIYTFHSSAAQEQPVRETCQGMV